MSARKFPVLHRSSVPDGLDMIQVPAITPKLLLKRLEEAKNGDVMDTYYDFDGGFGNSRLSEVLGVFDQDDFGKTFEIVHHCPRGCWLRNYLATSCPKDGSKGSAVAFVAWSIVNGLDYHLGTQEYFTRVGGGVIQLGIHNAFKNIFYHAPSDIEFRGYNTMLTFRKVR